MFLSSNVADLEGDVQYIGLILFEMVNHHAEFHQLLHTYPVLKPMVIVFVAGLQPFCSQPEIEPFLNFLFG